LAQESSVPDGLQRIPGLRTNTIWNNYEELNDTLSGRHTVNDTMGTCIQNKVERTAADENSEERQSQQESNSRKLLQ